MHIFEPKIGAPASSGGSTSAIYSLTLIALTSNPAFGASVSRVASYSLDGSMANVWMSYTQSSAGTTGSGLYVALIPPTIAFNASLIRVNTDYGQGILGNGVLVNGGGTPFTGRVKAYDNGGGKVGLVFYLDDGFSPWGSALGPNLGDTSMSFSFHAAFPYV